MIRIPMLLLLTVGLTGCASISHPLPKCDGYSRRPLNRSMWQWENTGKEDRSNTGVIPANSTSPAASFAEEPASATPAALAHLDIVGSYDPCEGK
jgi:type IV secretion system protein VirB7